MGSVRPSGTRCLARSRCLAAVVVLVLSATLLDGVAGADTGGSIAGAVTSKVGPLAGMIAIALDDDEPIALGGAFTDTNGQFTISGLTPGNYKVAAVDLAQLVGSTDFYIAELYDNAGTTLDAFPAATSVTVTDGATANINPIQLDYNHPGSITGTVSDMYGPLEFMGAVVSSATSPSVVGSANTDATGSFTIGDLPPGNYKLAAFDYVYGLYQLQVYENAGTTMEDFDTATPITVSAGAQTTVNPMTLQPMFDDPMVKGSAGPSFGNNLAGAPTCINPVAACAGGPTGQPQLWAAIQSPYEAFQNGDPYATKCAGDTETVSVCNVPSNPNGAQNPLYRTTGYRYALDVPPALVGTPITVEVYDAVHCDSNIDYRTSSGTATDLCPNANSGAARDNYTRDVTGSANTQMADIEFELFDSDGSDETIDTSPELSMNGRCAAGPGRLFIDQEVAFPMPFTPSSATNNANNNTRVATANTYKNRWATLCTFTPTRSGIHPMRVKSSAIEGETDSGSGYNSYALRATTPTLRKPRLYAIGDMSIWNTSTSATSKFYLEKVGAENKGKQLIVDLFDPGDGTGSSQFTIQVRTPPGGVPHIVPQNFSGITPCRYNATPSATPGPDTPDLSDTCTIVTKVAGSSGGGKYNAKWLRVAIDIPSDYSCTYDCWWSVWYSFGSSGAPTDRTVWSTQIVDPP